MSSYLDGILAWHRARALQDPRDLDALAEAAAASVTGDPPRPFTAALCQGAAPAVIAEIKRRSPSKGDLDPDLDPASLARDYADGGAACLSVLTDGPHFGGSPEDLSAARAATSLPVLRKDFTVCEADLYDARLMGADALLLIVAALGDDDLRSFLGLAGALHLAALVEVHDLEEAARALAAGAQLIGVNQRDLRTFELDTARAEALAAALPAGIVKVAESGIGSRDDVIRLGDAGYDAVLVGEQLVRSPDRALAVRALRPPAGVAAANRGAPA
ncbi:MAG TPA: indole-3-glycerol phosphate synthase TrpC [Acidimicrobiales bacterium]|nr:indole-3-glycerol phosphate synthase TrpC [Acidimicrobiales bacterium]